jgi:anti-anti-sigma factor
MERLIAGNRGAVGPLPGRFAIQVVRDRDETVLLVRGELDFATAPELLRVAAARGGRSRLVIDLGAVTFMDSSGLRALIQLRERAHAQVLAVRAPRGRVRRLIELAAADRLLPMIDAPPHADGDSRG